MPVRLVPRSAVTSARRPAKITRDEVTHDFLPQVLRQYALLADGERGVLVGPQGNFAWMCAPRWHSDAVFSSLVGGGGEYAVTPYHTRFVWGGHYEEGSLIWRDRWVTTNGITECREALAFPGDPHVAVVLRRVEAVQGPARVLVRLDVRAEFGRRPMTQPRLEDGVWTASTGSIRMRWSGAGDASPSRGSGLTLVLELAPGDSRDLVLELTDGRLTGDPVQPDAAWAATASAWGHAVPELGGTVARRDARHAYTVLRGLTSSSGAMVAAATTSLPEHAEEGRNYDYRYAWIRDQCYAGQAVAVAAPLPLLDAAVSFVSDRVLADGPKLKPAYTVDGEPVPTERPLDYVTGYPGATLRVGNRVQRQFQLDSLGESLCLFAAAGRHDHLGSDHWRAVEATVAAIEARWREPDAGIWEIDTQRWAHSRLMCVAGLRAMAEAGSVSPQRSAWSALADAILADVGGDCLHPTGRWQRSPGDARVDSSLLLASVRGGVDPADPRTVATLAAVESELTKDGYLYRFRQDARPLDEAEGAFLLCGFVMALALHQQGRAVEARAWFERNRAACGPPGLLTEEFAVAQRQLRGNIPQSFVHALLLESATRLGAPWSSR